MPPPAVALAVRLPVLTVVPAPPHVTSLDTNAPARTSAVPTIEWCSCEESMSSPADKPNRRRPLDMLSRCSC